MYRKVISLTIMLVFAVFGQSQKNAEDVELLVAKGEECLKSGQPNCEKLFSEALALAKNLKIDSLECKTLYDIGCDFHNFDGNYEASLRYLNECLSLSKAKNLPKYTYLAYYQLTRGLSYQGKYDDFEAYCDSALMIANELNDPYKIASVQIEQAWGFQNQGKYKEAYELLLDVRDSSLVQESKINSHDLDANLGTICAMNDDYDLAVDHFQRAYEGHLALGDTGQAYSSLTNICNCHLFQGQVNQQVIKDLEKVTDFYVFKNLPNRYIFPKAQLGRAHSILGNYQEANEVLIETIKTCEEIGATQQTAYVSTLLSDNYRAIDDFENAIKHSLKAYLYQKSQPISQEYLTAFEYHAAALNGGGFHEEAMAVQLEYQAAKDSLYDLNKASEIARIQNELEVEKIQNELLSQENEVFKLEKEKEAIFKRNVFLGIGLLLTALIAAILIQRKTAIVKLKEIQNAQLTSDLEAKNKELTEKALHLAQKNSLLASLKNDLESLEKKNHFAESSLISSKISFDTKMDENWEQFLLAFKQTRTGFFEALSRNYPECSKSDIRLAALLSMNLGSKEIASILNISDMGVKKARYRLRKKLNIESDVNLETHLNSIT